MRKAVAFCSIFLTYIAFAEISDDAIARDKELADAALAAAQTNSTDIGGNVVVPIMQPKLIGVQFDANGGTGVMGTREYRVQAPGVEFVLPECQFTRSGWTFAGWSDVVTDNVAKWHAGDILWISQSLTFYAIWEYSMCSIVFDLNDGSGVTATKLVERGMIGQKLTVARPVRDGYEFTGWFTSPVGGVRVTEETVVETDVTWYAHWEKEEEPVDPTPVDPIEGLTADFDGSAVHTFNGLVYDSNDMCGMVQITTAKATAKGVKVSGSVILEDGKKQTIKATTAQVSGGYLKVSTAVGKLGTLDMTIGGNGFQGTLGDMTVATADVDESTGIMSATVKVQYFDAKTGKIMTKSYKLTGVTSNGEAVGNVSLKNDVKSFEAVIE